MEWPASSPDLNPTEHSGDQLGRAVHARVTNTTTLADLRQMLVEEWGALPQQCVLQLKYPISPRLWCRASILKRKAYVRNKAQRRFNSTDEPPVLWSAVWGSVSLLLMSAWVCSQFFTLGSVRLGHRRGLCLAFPVFLIHSIKHVHQKSQQTCITSLLSLSLRLPSLHLCFLFHLSLVC